MHIWICNQCHAEMPDKDKPDICPICGGHKKGFDESEKKIEKKPDDEKYTKMYEEVIEKLESYEEGCEPSDMRCLID